MKKTYITPTIYTVCTTTQSLMIASSIIIDSNKSGGDALTKEQQDWDIWYIED